MNDALAIGIILEMRRADAEAMRLCVISERAGLARAFDEERGAEDQRDGALATWQGMVSERLAQPAMVQLAARWVIGCEQKLAGARLDRSIAEQRHERADGEFAQSRAQVMATEALQAQLVDAAHRRDTERQMSEVEDLLRARRGK